MLPHTKVHALSPAHIFLLFVEKRGKHRLHAADALARLAEKTGAILFTRVLKTPAELIQVWGGEHKRVSIAPRPPGGAGIDRRGR